MMNGLTTERHRSASHRGCGSNLAQGSSMARGPGLTRGPGASVFGATDGYAFWRRWIVAAAVALGLSGVGTCFPEASTAAAKDVPLAVRDKSATPPESAGRLVPTNLVELKFTVVEDRAIELNGRDSRWQLQVTGTDASGQMLDLSRLADIQTEPAEVATVDGNGLLVPQQNGAGKVIATFANVRTETPFTVSGIDSLAPVSFANQVVPVFTKFGCNGGGCHGKAAGQNGFKLSLLGFEPQEDYEHLVYEARGRRLFPAAPEASLLLQKAINDSPHGGGKRLDADSPEYRMLVRWIAQGMPATSETDPYVQRIAITPQQRTLQRGVEQQISALAFYSDGSVEDISRSAQYESNNTDIADVDRQGLVTLKAQAGDAAVMVRYQGHVAVFRASVPLGIAVQHWPASRNVIDDEVFGKLKDLGIPPADLCDDATFLRRVTLDIAGRLPSLEETENFLADPQEDKMDRAVDRLLATSEYADFFAKKWITILRNRRQGEEEQFGSFAFHQWVRESFLHNKPYDQWVQELLTASGPIEINPAVAWYREVPDLESRVEDAAQLFLGQRIQCARCHHHPYEKWSQADYYHFAAYFSKVESKATAFAAEPHFVSRVGLASAQHPKSGQTLVPAGLAATPTPLQDSQDPRFALVDWMTQAENPFFARSLVNRYWKHFMGRGLVEPEDDMRVTNPASNPELLDAMAREFTDSGYDLKALIRLICTSNAYRLSSEGDENNLLDSTSYARFYPKRLPAEVLLDSLDQVLASPTSFAGMPAGTRAVTLPDTSYSSYFLTVFGQPDATTACECERSQEATLAQSLHLLNSKQLQSKLSADDARPALMSAATQAAPASDHAQNVRRLYLLAFSRPPHSSELQTAVDYIHEKQSAGQASPESLAVVTRQAYEDLLWAIVNSKEFLFNH